MDRGQCHQVGLGRRGLPEEKCGSIGRHAPGVFPREAVAGQLLVATSRRRDAENLHLTRPKPREVDPGPVRRPRQLAPHLHARRQARPRLALDRINPQVAFAQGIGNHAAIRLLRGSTAAPTEDRHSSESGTATPFRSSQASCPFGRHTNPGYRRALPMPPRRTRSNPSVECIEHAPTERHGRQRADRRTARTADGGRRQAPARRHVQSSCVINPKFNRDAASVPDAAASTAPCASVIRSPPA